MWRWRLLVFTATILARLPHIIAKPIVKVGKTDIIGKHIPGSRVDFFGGIPYAKPPLGELRLNLPVLTPTLDVEKFDATRFGPGCIQIPSPPSGISEDCLSVTIFRPSGVSSSAKLPVLAWFYGGGFVVGDSSYYDATKLVTRSVERDTPIIFVSINYRVGPLGFPMGKEAGDRNIVNLGLYDQLAGLEWIQANIAKFGGDKNKVTIMGESAGAVSIQVHLQETRILGLARAAIIESGALIPLFGPEVREADWETYVSGIPGCASSFAENRTIDCIRKSDTASLLQAQVAKNITFGGMAIRPVIDGPQGLVPGHWSQNPPQAHLPLLLGTNLDEGTMFVPQNINSTAEIRDYMLAIISPAMLSPSLVDEGLDTLLELYPDVPSLGSPFRTGNNTFGLNSQYKRTAAIIGDFDFTSGRRTMAQTRSKGGQKIFAYLFTDREATAVPEFAPSEAAPGSLGVPHTAEIPFVFGTLHNVSAKAMALSTIMQDYWISFVTTLDPNDDHGEKRPRWQQYTPDNEVVIQLDGEGTTHIPDDFRKKQLAFFADNPDLFNTIRLKKRAEFLMVFPIWLGGNILPGSLSFFSLPSYKYDVEPREIN